MVQVRTSKPISHGSGTWALTLPLQPVEDSEGTGGQLLGNWLQFFCTIKYKFTLQSMSKKRTINHPSPQYIPSSKPYVSDHTKTEGFSHNSNLLFCWLSSQIRCLSGSAVRGLMWQFQVLEQLHTSSHTQNPGLLQGRPGMKAKSLQTNVAIFPGWQEQRPPYQILRWLLEGKRQIKLM